MAKKNTKLSAAVGAYSDVKRVMDAALANAPMNYKLPTKGKAFNFRHRCYAYRKILAEQQAEIYADTPGVAVSTPYDAITISREDATLVFYVRELEGVLTDAHGNIISPEAPAADEELTNLAAELDLPLVDDD